MSEATNSGGPQKRTGPAQFLKEVRTELRRVAWPTRAEVAQYSVIVLVVLLILGGFVFALDQVFGQLVFWIFG